MDRIRISKQMPKWIPTHGRRKTGRPRTRWEDNDIITKHLEMDVSTVESSTMDKNEWKRLVKPARAAPLDAN